MTYRNAVRILGIVFLLVVIIAIVASGSSKPGPVSQNDAINHLIDKITSGPAWETKQDSDGVSGYLKWQETGNGNDGGGACAYVNGRNDAKGFACYLQASEANGAGETYYSENRAGSGIRPISRRQYNRLTIG